MQKRKSVSSSGQLLPKWAAIQPDMVPTLDREQVRSYSRLFWEAQSYTHYEVSEKHLSDAFSKYVEKVLGENATPLNLLPEYSRVNVASEYAYMHLKGVGLQPEHKAAIVKKYEELSRAAKAIADKKAAEAVQTAQVINIQLRMRDQLSGVLSEIDAALGDVVDKKTTVKLFDPYKIMIGSDLVKPAHARIIRNLYQREYEEAQEVFAWKDEQIKEAYSKMTANCRREYVAAYEKLMAACDSIISVAKAVRKPRTKKAPSVEKLVAGLKYQKQDISLKIASVAPETLINATQAWIYNSKNRTLTVFNAAPDQRLTVKATTLLNFDLETSITKKLRNPETQLGHVLSCGKVALRKLMQDIKTKPSPTTGRFNDHTIIVRVVA